MAPAEERPDGNALVSTGGGSELQAILHPLVLLSISDYVARHTLRSQSGPLVGGLLGQQNGREITIEHAFDVHMISTTSGEYNVEAYHFQKRLEQMRVVHKDRQLDFVGWYTLLPSTGPDESVLDVHRFFLSSYNESAVLLALHPDEIQGRSAGGKLPVTIYESNWEVEAGGGGGGSVEDKTMDDVETTAGLQLRFRELNYSVETEETEMISMNYIAGGGSSAAAKAAAATSASTPGEDRPPRSVEIDPKGKRRLVESPTRPTAAVATEDDEDDEDEGLTRDEEEIISTLTTKANAIQMLKSRIDLIKTYLERLPPADGEDTPDITDGDNHDDDNTTTPSLPILRQIQALVSRLDLVIPSDKAAFEKEMLQESNDVRVVELLNKIMQGTEQAREVGKKYAIIEASKQLFHRGSAAAAAADYHIPPSLSGMAGPGDIMMK
ncbi:COP9 signalosome complex subunit 6 [Geosmithia morbida]|uniref:COP9 signalosome complex subunit 6 n=1 Tax=Geosmithia morbida TaxID=1094350 RepID=A0A9P4Z380_9HYPO|nr:COP9 signalosome complex subunit 6 [Geosmithia morbida]KAF4126880.1 COP9 signalosome complex subunit 6 [Geosmithia morbida]